MVIICKYILNFFILYSLLAINYIIILPYDKYFNSIRFFSNTLKLN